MPMKKITSLRETKTLPRVKPNHYAVIMAGGSGTRLWPMSRKNIPKQFQALFSNQTMLQLMYQLLREVFTPSHIFVQTDKRFLSLVEEQLPELQRQNILLEPEARDTAPAFGYATAALLQRDQSAIVGIFYSDHLVKNRDSFVKAVKVGFQSAEDYPSHVIMIGVKPTFPHTGLGYIQMNSQVKAYDDGEVFNVDRFVEKPDYDTAKSFVESWEYLWNTGYKICAASTLFNLMGELDATLGKHLSKISETMRSKATEENKEKIIAKLYGHLPIISFEYLATERLDNLLVVPSDMRWSDIGDWSTLHDMLTEVNNHHMITKGHHIGTECESCLIYGGERMIATLGLKDIIIVDTGDVILVANKHHAREMKKLITVLEDQDKHIYL